MASFTEIIASQEGSYSAGLYCTWPGEVHQRMHKVPERFRKGNEEFYRSRVVTIGPFHDFDAHLRCARIKLEYESAFAGRYSCSEDHLVALGRRLGERARDYYYWAPPFEQIPGDFGLMMLMDGIFLLELMLRSRFPEYRVAEDPIYNSTRIIVDVCRDILLMDNQLPLFVLEELYRQCVVPHPRPDNVSLPQLARHFFNAHLFDKNNIPPTPTGGDEFQFDELSILRNLVAFVRSFYSPRPKSSRSPSASDGDTSNNVNDTNITVQLNPPSVSQLYEAGVKLDKLFSASSGLNIEFDKGLLKIPHLDYWTGTFFLNAMAFEENEYFFVHSGKYVSQFMFFMGWMIRTSKDVDILIENGIISSMLGNNTDLVSLFDRISKMGWPHNYYDLCQELNDYCTSNPWHKWKATLKRDYFDTPWKIASTIAAVILLLLTLMQTVCSFLSLKP